VAQLFSLGIMDDRTMLKALCFAVLTEMVLTIGSALSFFIVAWYAVLLYAISHPLLFVFYNREKTEVDSMWTSALRHLPFLTLFNIFVLSFLWYFIFSYFKKRKNPNDDA